MELFNGNLDNALNDAYPELSWSGMSFVHSFILDIPTHFFIMKPPMQTIEKEGSFLKYMLKKKGSMYYLIVGIPYLMINLKK